MQKLGKQNFDLIKKIYDLLVNYQRANDRTFNIFVKACCQSAHFQEGFDAFNEAKEKDLADAITYSSFIELCILSGKYNDAETAFNENL